MQVSNHVHLEWTKNIMFFPFYKPLFCFPFYKPLFCFDCEIPLLALYPSVGLRAFCCVIGIAVYPFDWLNSYSQEGFSRARQDRGASRDAIDTHGHCISPRGLCMDREHKTVWLYSIFYLHIQGEALKMMMWPDLHPHLCPEFYLILYC